MAEEDILRDSFFDEIVRYRRNTKISKPPEGLEICNEPLQSLFILVTVGNVQLLRRLFPFYHYNIVEYCISDSFKTSIDVLDNCDKILVDEKLLDDVKNYIDEEKIIVFTSSKYNNLPSLKVYFNYSSYKMDIQNREIVVIRPIQTGILWLLNAVLSFSQNNSCLVKVDMQNYQNMYISEDYMGLYNPWDYYFKPLLDLDFKTIYSEFTVCFLEPAKQGSYHCDLSIFSEVVNKELERETNRILTRHEDVLGVFLRGSDYAVTPWHMKPTDSYESIEIIEDYLSKLNWKYILLDTEDENILETFKAHFQNRLLFLPRKRCALEHRFNNKSDPYNELLVGLSYIVETLLVTKTQGVLSSEGSSGNLIEIMLDRKKFFKRILVKLINGYEGPDPIIIKSYGKNILNLGSMEISEDYKQSVVVDQEELILKPYNYKKGSILATTSIFILPLTSYSISYNGIVDDKTIGFRLINERNELDIGNDIFHTEEEFSKLIIIIKKDLLLKKEIKLRLQIEKGYPSSYEPFHYSEYRIALKDNYGIYYNHDYLNKYDFEKGFFVIGGHNHSFSKDVIFQINNIVHYRKGTIQICSNTNNNVLLNPMDGVNWEWVTSIIDNANGMQPAYTLLASILIGMFVKNDSRAVEYVKMIKDPKLNRAIGNYVVEKNMYVGIELLKTIAEFDKNIAIFIFKELENNGFNEELFEICTKFSKDNNPDALGYLGRIYFKANDVKKAIDYYNKAMANGNEWVKREYLTMLLSRNDDLIDMEFINFISKYTSYDTRDYLLSIAYSRGKGVEKDENKAIELLKSLVEKWNLKAFYDLFNIIWKNNDADDEKYLFNTTLKYAQKDAKSMLLLSLFYKVGKYVKKDYYEAIKWAERAMKEGVPGSSHELFDLLWKLNDSEEDSRMFDIAMEGAISEDKKSMIQLSYCYKEGRGTKTDLNMAAYWLKKSAEKTGRFDGK